MVNATSRPLYPREKTRYTLYRKLTRPQGPSGRVRKISSRPTGIRSPDRPVRSESLYRPSNAGPQTWALSNGHRGHQTSHPSIYFSGFICFRPHIPRFISVGSYVSDLTSLDLFQWDHIICLSESCNDNSRIRVCTQITRGEFQRFQGSLNQKGAADINT